jgi:hypothetical protein
MFLTLPSCRYVWRKDISSICFSRKFKFVLKLFILTCCDPAREGWKLNKKQFPLFRPFRSLFALATLAGVIALSSKDIPKMSLVLTCLFWPPPPLCSLCDLRSGQTENRWRFLRFVTCGAGLPLSSLTLRHTSSSQPHGRKVPHMLNKNLTNF